MTPEKLAFINLVSTLGLRIASVVWQNVNKSATVDEAIEALKKSEELTADDFARERQV